jgi:hypothetical protein
MFYRVDLTLSAYQFVMSGLYPTKLCLYTVVLLPQYSQIVMVKLGSRFSGSLLQFSKRYWYHQISPPATPVHFIWMLCLCPVVLGSWFYFHLGLDSIKQNRQHLFRCTRLSFHASPAQFVKHRSQESRDCYGTAESQTRRIKRYRWIRIR